MTWPWTAGVLALAGVAALLWLHRRYDHFRAWTITRLRDAHPDLLIEWATPTVLTGRLMGVPVRLDFPTLFRRLRGRAETAALDGVIDRMRAAIPAPDPPPFAYVRGAILPLIKRAAFAEVYQRYPLPLRPAALPFAEDLVVVYAVLGFQQITFVTAGMQQTWQVGAADLHRLALENLRRRTEHLLAELGGPQTAYEHLDGFEASRILIPDLVAPSRGGDPLLAIPDEHVLLVAGADEAERLAKAAGDAYAAARSPLTPAIFRLREASLVPEVVS